jgi:hypothetical protein
MKATPEFTLPPVSAGSDQWVIFNIQETGWLYYHTYICKGKSRHIFLTDFFLRIQI